MIRNIVVSDNVLLEPGNIISCDGAFLPGHTVRCDESSTIGKSDVIKKFLTKNVLHSGMAPRRV